MNRRQDRAVRSSMLPSLAVTTLLLLALALGGLAQAAHAAPAGINAKFKYALHAVPEESTRAYGRKGTIALCPGELGYIKVFVVRYVDGDDAFIPGGRIYGLADDPGVVGITPSNETVAVAADYPGGLPFAVFTIVAGSEPGRKTRITFESTAVGDEELFPGRTLTAKPDSVEVEVDTCYEATQSALGTEWAVKDICSLKRPFVLEGTHTMSVGGATITTHTLALFFAPRRTSIFEGRYAFVNEQVTVVQGYTQRGIEFGSGSYTLGLNIEEGDLTLNDEMVNCFSGDCFLQRVTGYRILLKPLPGGQACAGELP